MPIKKAVPSRRRRTPHGVDPRGSIIRLRSEYEERYMILHRHVFPEVLRQIRKSAIRNYSIFLRSGTLFAHFEYRGKDFGADMQAMAADPVTRDWWKLTEPMQEPLPGRGEGEWWASLAMVLNMAQAPPAPHRYAFVSPVRPGTEDGLRQACAGIPPAVVRSVASCRFRNVRLYLRDGMAYLYFEYAGRNLQSDALRLSAMRPFAEWREMIERHFNPGQEWNSMPEVFHTA